jgi:hypothetical protein
LPGELLELRQKSPQPRADKDDDLGRHRRTFDPRRHRRVQPAHDQREAVSEGEGEGQGHAEQMFLWPDGHK